MTIAPTSRYAAVEHKVLELPDGSQVVYLARRIVSKPADFEQIGAHVVKQGERPDQVAAEYLGDPEQFWRLCDANGVLRPEELTEDVGTIVRITLPQGIAGPRNA